VGSSRDEAQQKNVWRWRQEIARKAKAGGAQLTGGREVAERSRERGLRIGATTECSTSDELQNKARTQ